ncbi:hypothetical protein [Pseudoxanthomonas sp. Root630]|nr:hypothetical protein [Pseudoxanthomonas sp. Root630]
MDQINVVSGGSEESYGAGYEVGHAIGSALKWAGAISLVVAIVVANS